MTTQSQITFTDIATDGQTGITYRRVESLRNAIFDQIKAQPFTRATVPQIPFKARGAPGVAIFDHDGDGDQDIYVTNGPGASNSLYSNQLNETGQVSFIDVAAQAGVEAIDQDSTGVSYGDIDNDGDADLLVLGAGSPNRLFENQGDGTFTEITAQSNIAGGAGGNTYSASASMGDVNGDGLLDIVIGNTFDWTNQIPLFVEPFAGNQPNQLLINQGNNVFEDVSDGSGLTTISSLSPGVSTITWAIAMVDYDLDGDLDIVHADDQAAVPSQQAGGSDRGFIQVFENDGTGTFTNVTEAVNLNKIGAWMGLAFGDLNADGNLDIFASNLGSYAQSQIIGVPAVGVVESRWFLGQDDGTFADPGVGDLGVTPFGWGASTVDYDNDADTDIVFHGGIDFGSLVDLSNPGAILENDGAANFRYDLEAIANTTDHLRRTVQGSAVGDLNGDGFEDIISVSNFDTPASVPITPLPFALGSDLDSQAGAVPNFVPGDTPGVLVWSGIEFLDGTLSVDLNSGDNGNASVAIETFGTVGLTDGGRVNRDGIGSVVFFTPEGGSTVIQPILGGSSYASQDSLIATLGLGSAASGTVEILWGGGVRNRLYDVEAGEKLVFPEIPVSFEGEFDGLADYEMEVQAAIDDLVVAEVLTELEGDRFLNSSIRAFKDVNGIPADLDFEGADLTAGTVITDQFTGLTIRSDALDVMIFDTANPTGGDQDLASDSLGNVMILSEDGDTTDPDDNATGGTFIFEWDTGVNIDGIGLLDVEEAGGSITLYDADNQVLGTVDTSNLTGDNDTETVDIGISGVSRMDVMLARSGAITDVSFF